MSRILIITTEPLPLPGWPTTGAGLRAWNLAEGLREHGHEVRLLMPDDCLEAYRANTESFGVNGAEQLPPDVALFRRNALADHPALGECDAVVLQHWGVARDLFAGGGILEVPLAIDLAGPHLLERAMWGSDYEADLSEKLAALRRADFVTVAGERQRDYFLPFLQMAGWSVAELERAAPVVPFSVRADASAAPARQDRFIVGGYLLPWQDPTAAIEVVLEELERSGQGELVFIGGAHPHFDFSRGRFADLLARMENHDRVRMIGPTSYDGYLELLREGGVALDLVPANAERRLAFTSRTVQYLACGLPVIHNDYAELSLMIEEAEAGWTLAPENRETLRKVIRQIVAGEVDVRARGEAAHQLALKRLNPSGTIAPLVNFCATPQFRPDKVGTEVRFASQAARERELREELEATRRQLNTLIGKSWVRFGLRFFSLRGQAALLMAVLSALAGAIMLPAIWISDRFK